MRILFAVNEPYLPEEIGGGILGIHNKIHEFIALGHSCEVVSALAGLKLTKQRFTYLTYRLRSKLSRKLWINLQDKTNGYFTNRATPELVLQLFRERLAVFCPDVVITQGNGRVDLAVEAIKLGYPAIIRAVTADCLEIIEKAARENTEVTKLLENQRLLIVSVSQFIATRAHELLGVESPLAYELICFDDVRVNPRYPEFITFVNPRQIKGLEVALKVAALLPHRKFLFVESWALDRVARDKLNIQLESLPNVSFRLCSPSMKDIYQSTSLLLAPSQWEEAFGRVIVEAGLNGIPTVASRIGGIPEAVSEGGILLSPTAPPEDWAATIEHVLSDKDLYAQLSNKAVLAAARPELNPHNIAKHFLQIAQEHASNFFEVSKYNSEREKVFVKTNLDKLCQ